MNAYGLDYQILNYGTARSQKAVTPSDTVDLPAGPCAALIVTADGDVAFVGVDDAGVNEIQTLTIDAAGGTFKLAFGGFTTAAITWSATNGTLISRIQAALDAGGPLANGQTVVAVGTMTAGVGTATITFSGSLVAHQDVATITVANNSLTGTATCSVAQTTAGSTPSAESGAAAISHGVIWASQTAGTVIPVQARRVLATGTSATVKALY